MGRQRARPELDSFLPKLYETRTLKQVAEITGLHFADVARRLNRLGVEMKPTGRPRGKAGPQDLDRHEKIVEMVSAGMGNTEIGKVIGETQQAVWAYVRFHGLPSVKNRRSK